MKDGAIEDLEKRYVDGKITRKQYLLMKKDLEADILLKRRMKTGPAKPRAGAGAGNRLVLKGEDVKFRWIPFFGGLILGYIIGAVIGMLPLLYLSVCLLLYILVCTWYLKYSLEKRDSGNRSFFLGMLGLIPGLIDDWIIRRMEGNDCSSRNVAYAICCILNICFFIILVFIEVLVYASGPTTTYDLGSVSNFTSANAYSLCNNDPSLVYSLFNVPRNYTVLSTYCRNSAVYAVISKP